MPTDLLGVHIVVSILFVLILFCTFEGGHILLILSRSYVLSDDLICLYQPDVVVNCAAISIPRGCEADPAAAMAVNVPSALIKWLSSFPVPGMLLIHLSTDQGRSITILFSSLAYPMMTQIKIF